MTDRIARLPLCAFVAVAFAMLATPFAYYMVRFDPIALFKPSDRKLKSLFHEHRAEFERLRDMALEDSGLLFYISEDKVNAVSVDHSRQEE